MQKEEIKDFLIQVFGHEEELIKSVSSYLVNDSKSLVGKIKLLEELWPYLQKNIAINSQRIYKLLMLLKKKTKDITIINNDYINKIDLIFTYCLENYKEILLRNLDLLKNDFENRDIQQGRFPSTDRNNESKRNAYEKLCTTRQRYYEALSYCDVEIEHKREVLLQSILSLVHEKNVLNLNNVHLSLMCGSENILNRFCLLDLEVSYGKPNFSLLLSEKEPFYTNTNIKYMFLKSIRDNECLVTMFYKLIIQKYFSVTLPENLPINLAWCFPFYIFIAVHYWYSLNDKLSMLPLFEAIMSNYGQSSDSVMQLLGYQKINHMKFTKWCVQFKPTLNVNKLLTILQNHSTLYAVQAVLPPYCLPYKDFLSLLLIDDQVHYASNQLNKACASTYQAYLVLVMCFHIILAGMEMDKVLSSWRERMIMEKGVLKHCGNFEVNDNDLNTCKIYYRTNVAKKWLYMVEILQEIYPLEYRLEILENMFSLLFVKHTSLSDEGKEDPCFDDSNQASPVSVIPDKDEYFSSTSLISSSSLHHSIHGVKPSKDQTTKIGKILSFKNIDAKINNSDSVMKKTEKISEQPKPSYDFKKSVGCPSLKLLTSTASEMSSSSSVGDFSGCGYIVNTLVAWDLLLILEDSLKELQFLLECHDKNDFNNGCIITSINDENFGDRLKLLKSRVADGLWRLSVILPESRIPGSEDLIEDLMKGTLYSSISSIKFYEVERKSGKNYVEGSGKPKPLKINAGNKIYNDKESITNFLLSSPQDLLSLSLVNDNLGSGEVLIQKYNLGNSKEKQELVLMKCLKENIPKIEEITKMKRREPFRKVSIEEFSESTAKKLETEIQQTSHNVAISALIDQVLNLSILESPEQNVDNYNETPFIKVCPKLIILDIALTSFISEENASKLFTIAFNQETPFYSSYSSKSSKPLLYEYFGKLPQLTKLCQLMDGIESKPKKSILKEGNLSIIKMLLPKTNNPSCLLLSKCPLNIDDFQSFQNFWVSLMSNLSQFENLIKKIKQKSKKMSSQNSENEIDASFKDILALINKKTSLSLSKQSNYGYLSMFIDYMKLLFSVLKKFYKSSTIQNYYELLDDRPVKILGDLIINQKVDPYQLEMDLHCMELDMFSVLIKYIVLPYEVHQINKKIDSHNSTERITLESFGCVCIDGIYALNANKLCSKKPVTGDILVRELLSSLLEIVQDINYEHFKEKNYIDRNIKNIYLKFPQIKTLLLECSELCSANIKELKGDAEILVFFINLANLMFIHAILLNFLIYEQTQVDVGIFATSKLEQIISFKRVGYFVGQLGLISLYDVLFRILKLPIVYDIHNLSNSSFQSLLELGSIQHDEEVIKDICIVPQPLLVFIVNLGMSTSPKLCVYYPDSFEDDLNFAVIEYFNNVIVPNLKSDVKSLNMNSVLYAFLANHSSGWNEAIKALKAIIGEPEEPLSLMYIERLKKLGTKRGNLKACFLLERVIIEYSDISERTLQWENPAKVCDSPVEPLTLPFLCHSYVSDNCSVISMLFHMLHISIRESNLSKIEDDVKNENIDYEFLNNLFSQSKMYYSNVPCIKNNFDKTKVFASLNYEPYYSPVIKAIENILKDIPQDDFLKRNVNASKNILKIYDMLSELPSIVLDNKFSLCCIWDCIMAYLSSVDVSPVLPTPWNYSYHIRDIGLRFKIIENNFIKWPIKIVLRVLNFLNCERQITASQKSVIQKQIDQMEIYAEIMKYPSKHFCLETCRDIAQASQETPEDLMAHLIKERQFSLALRWVKSHGFTKKFYFQAFKTSLLECLDRPQPDLQRAESILNNVSSDKLEDIVTDLLISISVHSTRKFLLSYFLNLKTYVKSAMLNISKMRQELIGLILVEDVAFHSFNRSHLISLIAQPYLIIEQWIMNLKFDYVEQGIKLIAPVLHSMKCVSKESVYGPNPEDSVDCLCWDHYHRMIENYTFKALEINGIQISLKHALKKEIEDENFVVPVEVPSKSEWQKNYTVSTCPVCKSAAFSLFCRRHHCRRCGRVVCAACSMNRHVVQGYGDVPVRVCHNCYDNLTKVCPIQDQLLTTVRNSLTSIESRPISENSSANSEPGWYFSSETFHNQRLREEFSFDYAPSLSLCQAVLNLHKEDKRAALCILKLSNNLFEIAIESFTSEYSEVDANFVLKMIQTLVSSAKIRFGTLWNTDGISLCEYYAQWVGVLQLLLNSRCISLLPTGTLANMLQIGNLQRLQLAGEKVELQKTRSMLEQERRYLRILRDNLVKKEMWELALDVSTKAGFETSGIWGAFAMSSLKAGDFETAREHFSKVLSKPRDKNKYSKSVVLEEIITYLETSIFSINQNEILEKEPTSESPKSTSAKPLIVSQTLLNLNKFVNDFAKQNVCDLETILAVSSTKNTYKLSALHRRECEYYIQIYGSNRMYIQFLVRHNRFRDTVRYSKEMNIDEKTFTEEVILPSFQKGKFSRLWIDIIEVDPKQSWSAGIIYRSCKYLERKRYLHCLLEVQKMLSDKLRITMTLVNLYTEGAGSYIELVHRSPYLTEALSYLQSYLDVIPLTESSLDRRSRRPDNKIPKKLNQILLHSSSWSVNRQITLATFQDEVAKYLAKFETNSRINCKQEIETIRTIINKRYKRKETSRTDATKFEVPTVFSKEERLALSVLVTCLDDNHSKNISLVYRLVETNAISPKDLLSVALETLICMDKLQNVSAILTSILEWGLIPTSQLKSVVWPGILAGGDNISENVVKEITKFISNPIDKMEIFMEANLCKLAFLQVNEKGKPEDLERLKETALKKGDKVVHTFCTKWLESYSRRQRQRLLQSRNQSSGK